MRTKDKKKIRRLYKYLTKDERQMLCDNCLEESTCKHAYNDKFMKKQCIDVADEVIQELLPNWFDDEDEDDE